LAGYSAKTACAIGSETLRLPHVVEALAVRQAAIAAELNITKDDIVSGILSAIAMARQQANPGAMIQGCTALAKLCGFFNPEVVQRVVDPDGVGAAMAARFAAMSDAELIEVASGS
jgi:hypothetical protein